MTKLYTVNLATGAAYACSTACTVAARLLAGKKVAATRTARDATGKATSCSFTVRVV